MKSKTRKTAGKTSLDPLVRGLTRLQIERAILFVERINHGAAYGHDPELCRSTAKTLDALRTANNAGQGAAKPYPAPAGSEVI